MTDRQAGFTLLEALLALAVLAVCTGWFYRGLELGLRGARLTERDQAALTVARSRLIEARALGPERGSPRSGTTDDGIDWTTSFIPYAAQAVAGAPDQPHLIRIDVEVSWRDIPGRPVRTLTLTTFRTGGVP